MNNGRHNLKKTVVVRALMLAFSGVAMTTMVPTVAFAQSNVTGTIHGQAAVGAQVVITNKESGARRTLTPDASGRFASPALQVGVYRVEQVVGGNVTSTVDNVEVRIGQGTEVALAKPASLGTVQVRGARGIDVKSIGSTTTLTARELENLPIAHNVGSVIMLAPNTTMGDARYSGGAGGGGTMAPSFGGASASENAYYINGFPVTTLLTQVGFSQLPFNSIGQAQVLTGGYGAEFGRSTGGVVNIVTKRGTNRWEGGLEYSIEPNRFRSKEKSVNYAANGTALDNALYNYAQDNRQTTDTKSFYLGGPLIKDKLFLFAAGEQTTQDRDYVSGNNNSVAGANLPTGFTERKIDTPRYLVKLDWSITDAHTLEYTRIKDTVSRSDAFYAFNYATLQRGFTQTGGNEYKNWGPTSVAAAQGAEVDIVKYTGYLTDNLTLTGVLGRTRTAHGLNPVNYDPTFPQISAVGDARAPGITYPNSPNALNSTLLVPGAFDENKGFRLDLDWKVNKQHTVRVGVDRNTINSKAGTSLRGGARYTYLKTDPGTAPNPHVAAPNSVAGNPLAQQGYYVEEDHISSASTPRVIQNAWYIEDRWQVSDRLLLSLGLRNEGFDNQNGDHQTYIKLNKQLAPRLGATWDALGDASTKVTGSIGRYHVPLPTNVAIRGAGSSLFTHQDYVYTGVDAQGRPTGTTPISALWSGNNEFGQAKDPRAVAGQDLKGNYQDELAVGFEKAVNRGLNVGAKFTYRKLRTAIDDFCDDRPFHAYGAANGIDTSNFHFQCALFNPGLSNTFYQDLNGDGTLERVPLTAAQLGYPKPRRTYAALDLFAEHPFDGKWWGRATYTFARNRGNTEGQLLSDIGQGDVSTTQVWDFPEFALNANGPLPNERKHQLKLFGYYQLTSEWGVGGNLLLASGRPKNCVGNAPASIGGDYAGYGSAYFFCNGLAAPRGSAGHLPSEMRFDANVTYKPTWFKGLYAKMDVFNLFNRQSVLVVEERYNNPGGATTVRPSYNTAVAGYSAPRAFKFTVGYDHKF